MLNLLDWLWIAAVTLSLTNLAAQYLAKLYEGD